MRKLIALLLLTTNAFAGITSSLTTGGVPSTRNIFTTSPLQGGGNLSGDRTFSILQSSTAQNGYLSSTDWNIFNNKQNALSNTPFTLMWWNAGGLPDTLSTWAVQPWYGLFQNLTINTPVDAGDVNAKLNGYEVEINPIVNTAQYHPTALNLDVHIDRSNSGGDLNDATAMRIINTVEGRGDIGQSNALVISHQLGNGSLVGATGTGEVINVSGAVAANYTVTDYNFFNSNMSINGDITNNFNYLYGQAGSGGGTYNNAHGFYYSFNAPVTNALNLAEFYSEGTVGGNFSGLTVNNSSDVMGGVNLVNLYNNGTLSSNFNGVFLGVDGVLPQSSNLFASNFGGVSSQNLTMFNGYANNVSTVNGDLLGAQVGADTPIVSGSTVGFRTNRNGVDTKGYVGFGSYHNGGNISDGTGNNAFGVDISFQNGDIDGGLFGVNINNNMNVVDNINMQGFNFNNAGSGFGFFGLNVYNNADFSESINLLNLSSDNADARTATAAQFNLSGNITDDIHGINLNMNPFTADSGQGINATMTGSVQGNWTGLNLDVSNVTTASTSAHVQGLQVSGGVNQIFGDWTPFSGANIEIGNGFFTNMHVNSGFPLTGTDTILQIIQSNLQADDDISTGAFGLDTNMIGVVSQLQLASGKTIPKLRSLLLGTSTPSGSGGTVTEHVVLEILGMPSFGGSVNNPTRIGIQDSNLLGQNFCDNATDCWFIRNQDVNAENALARLAVQTTDNKVFSDSLISLGDQTALTGDNHAGIRNIREITDPSSRAIDAASIDYISDTFTDDNTAAVIGQHLTTKVSVASGKTIGGLAGVFNGVSRAESGDDGNVPFGFGFATGFTSGNSATKNTALYASYFAGFHSIDSNAGQITDMYDFYAQGSSIGAGAVTNRYGIVIEPDSGYTKANWLSGKTLFGFTSFSPGATAVVHLQGGTASAGTASLKIEAGTLLTTPEDGAIESDGSNLSWTDQSNQRQQLNNGTTQFIDSHVALSQASDPVATVQAAAGVGATCTLVAGTDKAGRISVVTGAAPGTGSYCQLAFDQAYTGTVVCMLTRANSSVAVLSTTETTTTLDFNFDVAGVGATTYDINYTCEDIL